MAGEKSLALTDSAGFWVILFCGFGLIMMLLMGPKIEQRLAENAQASAFRMRQSGLAAVSTDESARDPQVSSRSSLNALSLLMAVGLGGGVLLLIRDAKKIWSRGNRPGCEPDD